MKKAISNLIIIINVLFLIWFIASIININLHNSILNANYGNFAKWNLFVLFFN